MRMACAAEAKHRNAPIILVGGRGRLSSIQAAELNGHLATATTDFLLNTRFAKYEVMKKTLKQMTGMKEMEKNGEESSKLQIVCVQLIDTLGNPKALQQTEPYHRIQIGSAII